MSPISNVLKNLGSEHCLIVYGEDGLDEISITGKTFISELHNGGIKEYEIEPKDFNLQTGTIDDIKGGSIQDNAKIALDILDGEKGPKRDIVVFNAGAAIYASGRAGSLGKGIELALESIDSGKAMERYQRLKELTK